MASKNIGRARLMQEQKNLNKENLDYLHAAPLETDLYTWHFTFRGPQGTDFHEGIYHGQILLPFEYPFKPPDIVFLNKNGRFEVNTKICLTITQYHTEQWNSAWTVRTMLEAVISLFNEKVVGHGYVEANSQVRRFFAKSSHDYVCEKCGAIKQIIKPRGPFEKVEQEMREKQDKKSEEKKLEYKQLQVGQFKQQQKKREKRRPQRQRKRRDKKSEYITPEQFFIEALKIGSSEYVSVIKSKKFTSK